MKQRKQKFTFGVKLISILSCLALISVGFASWWIVTTPEEPITEQGSFAVYAVETKNVTISAAFADENDAKISFGKDTAYTPTNKWLGASDDVIENLDTTLNVTVQIDDGTTKIGTVLKTVTVELTLDETTAAAVTAGTYIAPPTLTYTPTGGSAQTAVYNDTKKAYVLEIDVSSLDVNSNVFAVNIAFDWGTAFGGKNPYEYYDQAYTSALAADATTKLTALNNSGLNSGSYTVNITATVK